MLPSSTTPRTTAGCLINAETAALLAGYDADTRAAMMRRATDLLWHRGSLRYKLDTCQLKIRDALDASLSRIFFLLCSRRLGKSFSTVCLAIETALKKPGARILYLAPLQNNAAEITNDIAVTVLKDCPPELRPEFKKQDKEFHFRNGSVIRVKGVNGEHAQFLRGGAADLIILDEAGLMDDLRHVLNDVCMPMTLSTGGRILICTTPARSPSHESTLIYEACAQEHSVARFTILDTPRYADSVKAEFLIAAGEKAGRIEGILRGQLEPESTTARREYFCHFEVDQSSAVIPEFNAEAKAAIVKKIPKPTHYAHYDKYVVMDPGMKDKTGILFGYWDFLAAKLVIEAELILSGPNTNEIAEAIKAMELKLWGAQKPYMRISDVDLRLIADLWAMHQLQFVPARKEDSLGAVNVMRNMVLQRQLLIDPDLVHLVRQMQAATWNNKGTDFERTIDGHYDLIAALKYLTRMVNRNRNPLPGNFYQMGGVLGPAVGSWVSPKSRAKTKMGLYADTPFARKLAKRRGN